MDFTHTANAAFRSLMQTLSSRGMKPSGDHSRALSTLIGTLAYTFHGHEKQIATLSSLSPGMAKTTALQSFINHIAANPNGRTVGQVLTRLWAYRVRMPSYASLPQERRDEDAKRLAEVLSAIESDNTLPNTDAI